MSVRLEPLGPEHAPDLAALVTDPAVQRFTRVPVPPPEGFADRWVERYEKGRAEGRQEAFAIVDAEGSFLGLALVPWIEHVEGTAELGYVVAPGARGRGVATEALRRLTDWTLERGVERIELRISVENEPSKRVAARCGYVFEGVLRSAFLKEGVREDVEIWSRLPSDAAPR